MDCWQRASLGYEVGLAEWISEVWPDRKNGISDPGNRQSLDKIYMFVEGAPDCGMTGKL